MIASLDTERNMFFNFSQIPIRNQEIFAVLLVAIAVESFCSSFCHQEKPKQSSYISLWNALLRILGLPVQMVSVMITQRPCLRRNPALLRRSKAKMENVFLHIAMDKFLI